MTIPVIGAITDRKSILIGVSQMKSKQLSAPLTLGIVEAGRRLGLGRDAAYRAVSLGQIPSIMISTRRRVPTAALESLLETGTPSQTPATKLRQPKISHKPAGGDQESAAVLRSAQPFRCICRFRSSLPMGE
jgi:excisionase family DNA binding protein